VTEKEFKVETGLITRNCPVCGIFYAIPSQFEKERRDNHKTFYCPKGCRLSFPYETEEEGLERRLNYAQNRLNSCQIHSKSLDYKARYYKGKVTKLQKEIQRKA